MTDEHLFLAQDSNKSENATYDEFIAFSLTHLLLHSIGFGLIILATIIGNVFVIAAILLEKNLQNVQNYLVLSLAVADLMVAALVMPIALLKEVSKYWFLGGEVCDMWISFDVICCTSSILHLVCIALDRYWTVTRIDYIAKRSSKRILLMVCLSWIISVCISIPPLFGWKSEDQVPELTGECLISQNWGYTIYSTVGAFYLPLIIIIIIYIKIFRAAKSRIRKKHLKAYKDLASNMKPLIAHSDLATRTISVADTTEGLNGLTQSTEDCELSALHHPESNDKFSLRTDPSPVASPNLGVKLQNNNHAKTHLSPPSSPMTSSSPSHKASLLDITKSYLEKTKLHSPARKRKPHDAKNKLEAKRERKAARTLAIITGTFIMCWLPFFILALVRPFCKDSCVYPNVLMSIINWLGYLNSLLNPVIYTIFNPDFRSAFRKILFGQYKK